MFIVRYCHEQDNKTIFMSSPVRRRLRYACAATRRFNNFYDWLSDYGQSWLGNPSPPASGRPDPACQWSPGSILARPPGDSDSELPVSSSFDSPNRLRRRARQSEPRYFEAVELCQWIPGTASELARHRPSSWWPRQGPPGRAAPKSTGTTGKQCQQWGIQVAIQIPTVNRESSDGDAKITPVCHGLCTNFTPSTQNYPHIPGVQVDLFWKGSESEGYNVWIVKMRHLVRSRRRERVGGCGHANSATALDVACPGNDNFNIWKLNLLFGRIWNAVHQTMDWRHCRRGRCWTQQGHWFRIWQQAVSVS